MRCAVILLLMAVPAGAGELVGPPRPREAWALVDMEHRPPAKWELPTAAGLIIGANVLDAVSTRWVVDAGGHEANAAWLYGRQGERIVPAKVALCAAEIAAFHWLRKKHEAAGWAWVAGLVIVNGWWAHENTQLAHRLRTGSP